MKKFIINIVPLILIVGVALVLYGVFSGPKDEVASEETTQNQESASTTVATSELYRVDKVQWLFEPQAEGAYGMPNTKVRIQLVGVYRPDGRQITVLPYRLGVYQGSCAEITAPTDDVLPKGATSLGYAQCWFAGIGEQFSVIREGNTVISRVRTVAEEESQPEPFNRLSAIDLTTIVR
jgi:hypothetical protein